MNSRNLKKVYIFVVITALTWITLAFVITSMLISKQDKYSQLINKSGQQRMLSQKIILYISRINENLEDDLVDEKNELVNKMITNQKYILENLEGSKILDIYYDKPYSLSKEIEDFLNLVNSFDMTSSLSKYTNFYKKSEELLKKLDFAVNQIELESEDKLDFLVKVEILIFLFAFGTILLEIKYVVSPVFRKMQESEELKEENQELTFLTENLQKQAVELEELYANEAELKANLEDITKKLIFSVNEANAVVWNTFPLSGNIEYYYNDKCFGHDVKDVDTFDKWLLFVHPEDIQIILDSIEKLNSENKASYNFRYKNDKGEYLWLEVNQFVVERDFNGQIIEFSGFTQDITFKIKSQEEKEKNEAMLIHQSRLAQLGEMVSMIAHQWRQPLNILNISVGTLEAMIKRDALDEEKVSQIGKRITSTTEMLSQTIEDFRNFYQVKQNKSEFNISDMIDKTLSIVNHDIKYYKINIKKEIPKNIVMNSYENELSQVIISILSNSIDIFKEKRDEESFISLLVNVQENEIIITIEDNAGGIPKDVLPRIFEPYFTTKAELNGTGLGLYMSKMILEKSFAGTIEASNVENGAKFTIKMGGVINL